MSEYLYDELMEGIAENKGYDYLSSIKYSLDSGQAFEIVTGVIKENSELRNNPIIQRIIEDKK